MPNRELGRWHAEDEPHQRPSHYPPHGRHFPNFIPPQAIVPAHRGFWAYIAGRSWFLIVVTLLIVAVILPWLIALLSLLWAPVRETSNPTVSFFEGVHPFIREWLPTWTVGAIAGLTIGALVRILRKI